jgi:hypothetical protein
MTALAQHPLTLNARFRITEDDLQWILERKAGRSWSRQTFHFERMSLLRAITTACGDVDPNAIEVVRSWPANHRLWRERKADAEGDFRWDNAA